MRNPLMSLHELGAALQDRLLMPLPGADAHDLFRATPVGDVRPLFDHRLPPKPGGVMIMLYEMDGEICFPLIKRPDYTGAHGGQVSFPGGKSEPGEDVLDTALRECEEEIGIQSQSLRVVGKLSEFFVMPSNFMVTPVVAVYEGVPEFVPDKREVARVMKGSLAEIISDEAMRQKEILAAGRYRMMAPHFEIENEVVWGATAMMLNEFRLVVRDVLNKQ